MSDDLVINLVRQRDRRLGRQQVHDPASRSFAMERSTIPLAPIDQTLWRDTAIRIYDPVPNPNQPVGCCTGCAKAMEFNSVGNRRKGVVLGLPWALDNYRSNTRIDPFPGIWEPDDTGSSSLAACKSAQLSNDGGEYRFDFRGADGVVNGICADRRVQNLGTWWTEDMFYPDSQGRIEPTGARVGGHQYIARAYWEARDWVKLRCWWGTGYRDVWIRRDHLNDLILDGGDVHTQRRLV